MRFSVVPHRKYPRGVAAARREFMALGAAIAGSVVFGRAEARAAESFPPQDPPWSRMLGPSVVDHPYGQPSQFVKDVIRRNVPWLTATMESSATMPPTRSESSTAMIEQR